MQSPFSVYASTFLHRANATVGPASSTSSHPLFYSATGSSDFEDDANPFRRSSGDDTPGNRSLLDEEDGLPRLAGDGAKRSGILFDTGAEVTPYLDESQINFDSRVPPEQVLPLSMSDVPQRDYDDVPPSDLDGLPMMDSDVTDSVLKPPRSNAPSQGWRTHDSVQQPPSRPNTPSESSSISDAPPSYLLESPRAQPPPIPPTRVQLSAQLTESLLPRDGIGRALFHLPDPDRSISKSKYNDLAWMTSWLWAITVCTLGCLISLVFTDVSHHRFVTLCFSHCTYPSRTQNLATQDPSRPSHTQRSRIRSHYSRCSFSPAQHFRTASWCESLTSHALLVPMIISRLFRLAVRPMLVLAALSTPLFLFLSAAYAFSGSFFSEPGAQPTWGGTVGC